LPGKKRPAKYLIPKGAENRIYVPERVIDELRNDPHRRLVIAEGEKKAIAVRHHLGESVIGVPGVDGWCSKKRQSGLCEDFERILPLVSDRQVTVAYDSDVRENLSVAKAAHRLTEKLCEHGARASWAFPPPAFDGSKQGADDLLVAEGADAVRDMLDSSYAPCDPAAYVFRQRLSRTSPEEAREFAGGALYEELKAKLLDCPRVLRSPLAQEAKGQLNLTAQDRDSLLEAVKADEAEGSVSARGLQGQRIQLTDPDPWPEPVDGAQLLSEIRHAHQRFSVLPRGAATALALWDLHTHAEEAFDISPYCALQSPEKRCGKSTTLRVSARIVCRPLPASNISPASVFRTIEQYCPTLLIDEMDTFLRKNEEMRGILNGGHVRELAFTIRTVGDDHEARTFSTWCPKMLSQIGKLPPTLQDRSIVIPIKRKRTADKVERIREDSLRELEPLRRKAARWAKDHLAELQQSDPHVPEELDDRAADNWRPLLAIADLVGGEWPARARKAATLLSVGRDEGGDTIKTMLLADFRRLFDEEGQAAVGGVWISSTRARDALGQMEDRPWGDWGNEGKVISPQRISSLLSEFGIRSKQKKVGGENLRRYERKDFEEAFDRYLSSPESATPLPANNDGASSDTEVCYPREEVARPKPAGGLDFKGRYQSSGPEGPHQPELPWPGSGDDPNEGEL
jgi:putative DNA primase/helicase